MSEIQWHYLMCKFAQTENGYLFATADLASDATTIHNAATAAELADHFLQWAAKVGAELSKMQREPR